MAMHLFPCQLLFVCTTLAFARDSGAGVRPTRDECAGMRQSGTCDSAPAELDADSVIMLQRKMRSSSDDAETEAGSSAATAFAMYSLDEDPHRKTCPAGTVLTHGDACPDDGDNGIQEVTTTPAPFCDEKGMTASGKKCEGKIKTSIQTSRRTRACQTASGDDCEGEFPVKYRTTYEDKDGEWVKFKREMSRDGGETWKPLPLSLSELASIDDDAEDAAPRTCCLPAPTAIPCPEGTVLAHGDACPAEPTTTPAPFCDENGMTASGKKCEGKIKTSIQTSHITRPCQTASGDDCDGEFPVKYRTTYEDKDGEWVKFKREMSRDGGETWKPLPLLLSELATFDDYAEEATPRSCCVAAPTTTPTQTTTEQEIKMQSVLAGTVKDAKTNKAVEGATVSVQAQGLTATTDQDGHFHFGNVKAGQVVVTAQAEGYENYLSSTLTIAEGSNSDINIKMTPPRKKGQWTIVLTWTKGPRDLDSVTTFGECEGPGKQTKRDFPDWSPKGNGGEKTSVYWDAPGRECLDSSGMKGKQDIDNTDIYREGHSMGDTPETTTITDVDAFDGKIFFKVMKMDFWGNKGTVDTSDALVEVHGPDADKVFTVEKGEGCMSDDKKTWFVFYIDAKAGTVNPCKSLED